VYRLYMPLNRGCSEGVLRGVLGVYPGCVQHVQGVREHGAHGVHGVQRVYTPLLRVYGCVQAVYAPK
jgi:hypothetical protein